MEKNKNRALENEFVKAMDDCLKVYNEQQETPLF